MSKFHEAIRQLLEDVQKFLLATLNNEVLSATALSHKESLLIKLHHLRIEYPQLQLPCQSDVIDRPSFFSIASIKSHSKRLSSSPPPYIDMQSRSYMGQVSTNSSTDYVLSDTSTDYETYDDSLNATNELFTSSSKISYTATEDNVTHFTDAQNERHFSDVPASDLAKAEKSGYLEKKGRERLGGLLSPFQRRWCAIKDGVFYYYERPTDRRQKGQVDLTGYEARLSTAPIKDTSKKDLCFEIVCPGKRTYQFIAITPKDLKQWMVTIERNSHRNKSGINNFSELNNNSAVQSHSGSSDEVIESKPKPNVMHKPLQREPSSDQESIYETLEDEQGPELEDGEVMYDEGESMLYNDGEELYMDAESIMDSHFANKAWQVNGEVEPDEKFNPVEWYTSLWNCTADNKNELSFSRGDLIRIISKCYDSYAWWVGELNGKIGLVPKSYLMEAYEIAESK